MSICGCDAVVHCTQIGRRGDEVNVMVRVVVLLELDGVQAVANETRGRGELLHELSSIAGIRGRVVLHWLIVVHLDLDAAPRGEFGNENAVGDLLEDNRVGFATQAVVERMEISGRDDVLQMGGLHEVVSTEYYTILS